MAFWLDPDGCLHNDMNGAALDKHTWPANLGVALTLQTDAQLAALQAPTPAQQWAAYKASIQAALDATDITVHRVIEAVALGKTSLTTADVVAYMQYRSSLRAILSEAQPATIPTALPTKPAYPANT